MESATLRYEEMIARLASKVSEQQKEISDLKLLLASQLQEGAPRTARSYSSGSSSVDSSPRPSRMPANTFFCLENESAAAHWHTLVDNMVQEALQRHMQRVDEQIARGIAERLRRVTRDHVINSVEREFNRQRRKAFLYPDHPLFTSVVEPVAASASRVEKQESPLKVKERTSVLWESHPARADAAPPPEGPPRHRAGSDIQRLKDVLRTLEDSVLSAQRHDPTLNLSAAPSNAPSTSVVPGPQLRAPVPTARRDIPPPDDEDEDILLPADTTDRLVRPRSSKYRRRPESRPRDDGARHADPYASRHGMAWADVEDGPSTVSYKSW